MHLERVNWLKYFWVLLENTLTWKDHIEYIGKKISSRLGVLRWVQKVLPKPTFQMLYNTIVLPLLHELNRCATCIIEGQSIGAEELKSTLGWPSLQAHTNDLKCVSVCKCLHGLVSLYLLSEFRHMHFFHGYNTRSHDLLCPPFTKTAKYQESFIINGTQTFNTLSRNFRQVETLRDLKSSQVPS